MERGNRNTVLLTVIGVATLLVALVGATFAYFSATITDNSTSINVTSTQVSGLTMTSGASAVGSPLYPGWVGYQYIDIEATGAAGTTAKYSLDITVSGSGTGLTSMLGHVQYAVCKKLNQATAASDTEFASKTLATANVNSAGNQYNMINGNVALPSSGCTSVVADNATPASGTKLASTGDKSLASNQTISGTKHDRYYIIYRYLDDGDQTTEMGSSFTITPKLTPSAA